MRDSSSPPESSPAARGGRKGPQRGLSSWARQATYLVVTSVLVAACASERQDEDSGTCANVEGSWKMLGTCADTSCDITQDGCNVTVSCSPTGTVYKGTVSDGTVTFDSSDVSCRVSVNGPSANGSCTRLGVGCSWQASCASGACAGGGGGSAGSGSGVDCGPACLTVTSCCPTLSALSCQIGCEKTSGLTECKKCFDTTDCGSLVPCLMANCWMTAKICPGP